MMRMMHTGWGVFPWPVLFVILMIVMVVLVAVWLSHHRGAIGPGSGWDASPTAPLDVVAPPPAEDPVVILRERLVRGEIDFPEFEARLESLLRTETNESGLRQDLPYTPPLPGRSDEPNVKHPS
ncbi:MAG: SHOCT domain-containing protein [Acidimicrobiales bacterium]